MSESSLKDQITEKRCPYCGEQISSNKFRQHLPCDGVGGEDHR